MGFFKVLVLLKLKIRVKFLYATTLYNMSITPTLFLQHGKLRYGHFSTLMSKAIIIFKEAHL